jgi:hypothetical protein
MPSKIEMNAKVATGVLIAAVWLQLGSVRLVAESMTATQPTTALGSDAKSGVSGGATLSKVGPTPPSAASLRRAKEMQQAERDRAAREATYAADRAMRSGVTVADPVLSAAVVAAPVGVVKPANPVEAVVSAGTVNPAAPVRNAFAGKSVATLFAPPRFTPPPGLSDGRSKVAGQPTLFGSHEILLGQSQMAKRGGVNSTELRPVTLPAQVGVYRKDLPATVAPFSSAAATSRQMTLPALLP